MFFVDGFLGLVFFPAEKVEIYDTTFAAGKKTIECHFNQDIGNGSDRYG